MSGRVLELADLAREVAATSAAGQRLVLTNGVFDLLHVGHLRYLRQARQYGDRLVVGVNADTSVRGLKPGRPLVPEAERAELVAALEPVDYVVIFAEPTADALLRTLRPHVYVKGADYTPESVPEAETARAVGARLVFVPLVPHRSTSALVRAVRQSAADMTQPRSPKTPATSRPKPSKRGTDPGATSSATTGMPANETGAREAGTHDTSISSRGPERSPRTAPAAPRPKRSG